MNYYPLINRNLINIKDFSDERVIYLNELNFKKMSLNKNAKFIFDNCDGKNNIQDLVSLYLNTYNINEDNRLNVQKDIDDVLCVLNGYGIISWIYQQDPFVKCKKINNLEIYPVQLNNRYLIKERFQNSLYSIGITKETVYNNQLITNGIYTKLINSYFIKKDNKKCSCIMINMIENPSVWQVMAIFYNENFDSIEDFTEIYNYISLDLKKNMHKKKIQLGFYMNVKQNDIEKCRLFGFQEKGCLKHEADTDIYSMWHVMKG